MPKLSIFLRQIVAFTVFAFGIGYFSNSPTYVYRDPAMSLIKVSFSHASERKEECRHYSQEEIAALAPNMRRPMDCPRERLPIFVEVILDGNNLLSKSYNPTGLSKDGAASVYESIPIKPGQHQIVVKLRDSNREDGFDYEGEASFNLDPKEILVVDFRKDLDGFYFQ